MPRYIIKSTQAPKYDQHVARLVQELTTPGAEGQPLILEEHIPATGSRHVHVIWDEWEGISDEQRSRIIIDAYTQAEGDQVDSEITIALGVTPGEALVLGLLPYVVESLDKEAMTRTDHRIAFAEEARHTLLGANASQLRYPRREDADQAIKHLKKLVRRSSWEVIHEVQREM